MEKVLRWNIPMGSFVQIFQVSNWWGWHENVGMTWWRIVKTNLEGESRIQRVSNFSYHTKNYKYFLKIGFARTAILKEKFKDCIKVLGGLPIPLLGPKIYRLHECSCKKPILFSILLPFSFFPLELQNALFMINNYPSKSETTHDETVLKPKLFRHHQKTMATWITSVNSTTPWDLCSSTQTASSHSHPPSHRTDSPVTHRRFGTFLHRGSFPMKSIFLLDSHLNTY